MSMFQSGCYSFEPFIVQHHSYCYDVHVGMLLWPHALSHAPWYKSVMPLCDLRFTQPQAYNSQLYIEMYIVHPGIQPILMCSLQCHIMNKITLP